MSGRVADAVVTRSLADAEPTPLWHRDVDVVPRAGPDGDTAADLVVVGGGLTGLWAAICAKDEAPDRDVVLLEGATIAAGASGRNGGFLSDSLTHGLAHGVATWPREMDVLQRMGRDNLAETVAFCAKERIDASIRLCGKSLIATRQHHVPELAAAYALHRAYGEDVELLDAADARADVDSPTYLGALRVRSGGGLLDPGALCLGLAAAAARRGVRIHERTTAVGMSPAGSAVRLDTRHGSVTTRQVLLATNAYRPLLRRLRAWVIPVHDHVLATQPLTAEQLKSLGWAEGQGMTDAGNQFHYYRRTADDRIVWGGYDAIYYRGGRTESLATQVARSHQLLARHFHETFPQLEGLRFTHRWSGIIDTTSRFTPMFGTAMGGRVAYAVGYTGLGVGSSRFGARVALDLLAGRQTERTRLSMVRRRPVPFPPEPVRYPLVQVTRGAMARQDQRGRRGLLLSAMDRLGVGFDS